MAPHWHCKVTPRAGYLGGSVSQENSCSHDPGGKSTGGVLVRSETKIEVRNEDWPRGAYPRGLRLGRDPVMVILFPIYPRVDSFRRKLLFSRSVGGG